MRVITEKNPKKLELINPANGIWAVRWNIENIDETHDSCDQENFNHKPNLKEIKQILIKRANEKCSNEILSNFVWEDIPVYLSSENQNNYTLAYNTANINNALLPITLKLGTYEEPLYYEFSSIEKLNNFYSEMGNHIINCLKDCWEFKSNINLEEYK